MFPTSHPQLAEWEVGNTRPPRYDRVVYLCDAPARPVVDRAAAALPGRLTARLVVRDLPAGAVLAR